jgi:hypothetical protein
VYNHKDKLFEINHVLMCQCVNRRSWVADAAGTSYVNYPERRPYVTDMTSYLTGNFIQLCNGWDQKVWRPKRGAQTSAALASMARGLEEARNSNNVKQHESYIDLLTSEE